VVEQQLNYPVSWCFIIQPVQILSPLPEKRQLLPHLFQPGKVQPGMDDLFTAPGFLKYIPPGVNHQGMSPGLIAGR
jgi:hypothetical protein